MPSVWTGISTRLRRAARYVVFGLEVARAVAARHDAGISNPNEEFEFLDAAEVVADYREAVDLRDTATTPEAFAEHDATARALLTRWAEYNGGDIMELHAMAYGGPWQD